MQYYLYQNEQQVGPYTEEQITSMLANGDIAATDMIWHEGLPDWKPIQEVIALNPAATPAPPSAPPASAVQTAGNDNMSLFRKIRVASLLGALALFLMPWVDIQCSGTSLATQSGVQIIYGGSSPSEQMQGMGQGMEGQSGATVEMNADSEESMGYGPLVGLALLLVIVATIMSFVALKGDGGAADKFAGILPAAALGLLVIQLLIGFPAKREMMQSMKEGAQQSENSAAATDPMSASMEDAMGDAMMESVMANFTVEAKPAFYFELVALGIPTLLLLTSLKTRPS